MLETVAELVVLVAMFVGGALVGWALAQPERVPTWAELQETRPRELYPPGSNAKDRRTWTVRRRRRRDRQRR